VGVVTVRGREPSAHAPTRRRVGAVLAKSELWPARSVAAALARVGALRGADLGGCLDAFGLARLGERAPASLAPDEARSVELALALALPEPAVLAIYEPLIGHHIEREAVATALGAAAERGACVVVATSAPADLRLLPAAVHLLEAGRLSGHDRAIGWPPPASRALRLWLDPGRVRELAAALAKRGEIGALSWEAPADAPLALIQVTGADADAVAIAVAETVAELDVALSAIDSEAPTLELLRESARRERRTIEASSRYAPGGGGG
jgi:hypothetical protein